MSFNLSKNLLTTAALSGALALSIASPASAFNLFGVNFDQPSHSARNYTPRPFDGGGNVFSYYGRSHASSYSRTVIAGVCASACTMKLGSRGACVEPSATLMFHQASYNGARSELGTRMMLYSYPARIRHWVLRSGALNSSSLTSLSGSQAISMGMHAC